MLKREEVKPGLLVKLFDPSGVLVIGGVLKARKYDTDCLTTAGQVLKVKHSELYPAEVSVRHPLKPGDVVTYPDHAPGFTFTVKATEGEEVALEPQQGGLYSTRYALAGNLRVRQRADLNDLRADLS